MLIRIEQAYPQANLPASHSDRPGELIRPTVPEKGFCGRFNNRQENGILIVWPG